MKSCYLDNVPFLEALEAQHGAVQTALRDKTGTVIGFESQAVITLGVRGRLEKDVVLSATELAAHGYQIERVDRGGQATIHNPGQLVIFPVWPIRKLGVRAWIQSLAEITAQTLREWQIEGSWREDQPGLYTRTGKIMACGVRIRNGISTHGLSINVRNNLEEFAYIRSCGRLNAALDRMPEGTELSRVFSVWLENFRATHC